MNPLSVYPQLPGEGALTLYRGAVAYLDHLSLLVQADKFSKDRYGNLQRNLTRFLRAWSVRLADGRHVLVPLAEPVVRMYQSGRVHRYRQLRFEAGTAEEALVVGRQIAAERQGLMLPGLGGNDLVRVNGERGLGECSNDDLTRWLLVNPQWKSDYSKDDALQAIVACYAWYEDEYKVPSPFRRKRLPEFVKKPRREARIEEYVALMGKRRRVGERWRVGSSRQLRRALWCLYNVQGVRPKSMRDLTWTEFFVWDEQEGAARAPDQVGGEWQGGFIKTYKHKAVRKRKKPLIIALTPRQLRFFWNLYRQRPPWPANVFLNTDGKPWTRRAFAQHLRRTALRIGLDEGAEERVSAYCLRHTFATDADEAGLARADTAMLMGHGDEAMIREVYSKASSKVRHVLRAAEEMERRRRSARREEAKRRKRRGREEGGLF